MIYICWNGRAKNQYNRPLKMNSKPTDDSSLSIISNYIVQNSNSLKRYARKLTFPNNDEAEDLYQETAYCCLSNTHKYTHNNSAEGWIKTIMRNIYINTANSAYRRRTCLSEGYNDVKEQATASPDEKFSTDELYKAIEKLHPNDQQIIVMRLRGYSYDEIATETNKKIGTIKSSINRIKRHLRKLLD